MWDDIRVDERRVPCGTIRQPVAHPATPVPDSGSGNGSPQRHPGRGRRAPSGARGSTAWRHHDRRTRVPPHPDPQPRAAARPLPARAARPCPAARTRTSARGASDTIYVDRGKGGQVWDIDGNEYIDLRMGYGPVILGHGDDRVDDYVNERMRRGVSFSLTSEDEVRAMELVKELDRLGRQGPDDGVRHRGHDARDARRARLHRPRQDREVRGPVPRRPRLRADQRRARTTWPTWATRTTRSAWPGAAASRARSPRRSSRPATTTSTRLRRLFERAGRARSPRSSSSRSSATPRGSCPSRASTRRCGP